MIDLRARFTFHDRSKVLRSENDLALGNQSSGRWAMDVQDLHDRGLKLRIDMFGRDAVDKRMNALGDFGKPLQHIVNAYAYGDVWSRSALPPATKSLAMIAMMAAAGHPNEL